MNTIRPPWELRGRLFVGEHELISDRKRLTRWLNRHGTDCLNAIHVRIALDQIKAELQAISTDHNET